MAPTPEFMPISLRIGPFTTAIIADELDELLRAESSDAARARITGKYSGRAPAITAFTATCSTVNCQAARNSTGCKWPTISSGGWLVPANMASTRSRVGSTIGSLSVQLFSRNNRCRLSSVSGPITPAIGASMTGMSAVQRRCQRHNHLLHHRTRHKRARRFRQACHFGDRGNDLVELVGVQRHCRHAVLGLDRDRMRRDGRRAIAAMTDADDCGVTVCPDLIPGFRIVFLIGRGQRYDLGLHARHVGGEPSRNLLEQFD